MPWSINGREIFEGLKDSFPLNTEQALEWAEEKENLPEIVLVDLHQNMPQREWPDWETFLNDVQNYTWTMPDGSKAPVWGGVTQQGLS